MADKEKNKKFSLRKLFYNDKYLIVFSIIAAVVVWISTSMSLSPETTKTVTVPLNIDFSDSAAAQLGIKCYGDDKINVDVTVSCKKYLARDITADDFNVSLQTNAVTSKGNYEVPIKVSASDETADFTITGYYPTAYKGYFDVESSKDFDIEVNYASDNYIADGYVEGEPLLSQTSATVKGPATYVSQVKRLVANVNFDKKLKQTQTVDLTASAVDANGDAVDYVSVDTGGDLTLTVPVLKQMTLGVTASFANKPEGVDTSQFDIKFSKDKVNAAVLEDAGIKEANIGSIDFSKLKIGKNTIKFNVQNLESIVVLDNIDEITAEVTVPDTFASKKITLAKSAVTVANVPDGYTANVVSVTANSATLIGKKSQIENSKTGVGFVVDLSAYKDNISEGTEYYDITANIENADACWIYGSYQAQIEITKK